MAEGALLKKFMMEYSKAGWRLFRSYSGQIWTGKPEIYRVRARIILQPGDVVLRNARRVSGLPKGFSDLFGYTTMEVTEEMVGRQIAVFTAAEVKWGKTRTTKEQEAFVRTVNDAGGIAAITRKLEDFLSVVRDFKDGRKEGH